MLNNLITRIDTYAKKAKSLHSEEMGIPWEHCIDDIAENVKEEFSREEWRTLVAHFEDEDGVRMYASGALS